MKIMLRLITACTIFFSTFKKKIHYTFLRIIVHFWNIILRHSKAFDTKKTFINFGITIYRAHFRCPKETFNCESHPALRLISSLPTSKKCIAHADITVLVISVRSSCYTGAMTSKFFLMFLR